MEHSKQTKSYHRITNVRIIILLPWVYCKCVPGIHWKFDNRDQAINKQVQPTGLYGPIHHCRNKVAKINHSDTTKTKQQSYRDHTGSSDDTQRIIHIKNTPKGSSVNCRLHSSRGQSLEHYRFYWNYIWHYELPGSLKCLTNKLHCLQNPESKNNQRK